jgi:WD40-like Beta Propeller Repeat
VSLTDGARLVLGTATVGAMFAVPAAGAGARESGGIVFMCGRNTLDLCLARPDGTGRRHLTRGDALLDRPFGQVSRAGSLLAFVHRDGTIRIRTLGGRRVQKVVPRWRDPYTVELDRTGTRLLYSSNEPFGILKVCRLHVGTRRPSCFQTDRAYHAWGPGGTVISTDPWERTDICVERRGSPCARRIARASPNSTFFGPSALSHDGRRLVVIEELEQDPEADTRIVTFDARTGRRLRVLTTGHRDYNPSWSPDGRWIVFDRDAQYLAPRPNTQIIFASLWRVPADGGKSRRVTRRGYQPAWGS